MLERIGIDGDTPVDELILDFSMARVIGLDSGQRKQVKVASKAKYSSRPIAY